MRLILLIILFRIIYDRENGGGISDMKFVNKIK